MRFVPIHDLQPGMILAKTLYSSSMSVLLREGVSLTQSHINSFNRIYISGVYIDDAQTRDIQVQPLVSEELKLQFAGEVQTIFSSVKTRIQSQEKKLEEILKVIIEQISSKSNHMVNVFDLKSFDNYTFQHSVNVCILSIIVGINRHLTYDLLFDLALAGLYHDIGKMYINPHIINKPGVLTPDEFNLVKQHPTLGAEHIKKLKINRSDVRMGVLHHHERFDGTGYPSGFSGKMIGLFGKIVAITDVFDAITSERPYKHAMPPAEAVEYIMSNATLQFDYDLVKLFLHSVAAYPTGQTVRLSNGLTGVVADNYEGFTLRPLVKILPDDPQSPPYYINLKDDINAQNITVVQVI